MSSPFPGLDFSMSLALQPSVLSWLAGDQLIWIYGPFVFAAMFVAMVVLQSCSYISGYTHRTNLGVAYLMFSAVVLAGSILGSVPIGVFINMVLFYAVGFAGLLAYRSSVTLFGIYLKLGHMLLAFFSRVFPRPTRTN